jgi:preprotein translocase subunit SecA
LVGTASVEDSEDLTRYLRNKGLKFELLNAKNNAREAEIVAQAGQRNAITISTNMAGRGTDIKLGEGIAALGGLYVIGTERHESRRVDNQLRGRSGRQGDPGITRFFISIQDTLFRRFATEKEDKAENKIEKDVYDSRFFTILINNAQKKIEGLNFDTRKNLIDYDSVLSSQRELVYKQRDQILKNIDNTQIIKNMAKNMASDIANLFKSAKNEVYVDADRLAHALNTKILNANLISPNIFIDKTIMEAVNIITEILKLSIDTRIELLKGTQGTNIIRDLMIQNLDFQWTNHLDRMTKIREGVTLRSLEQRSPLNIYVQEADYNFNEMKKNVAHNSVIALHRIYIPKVNEELHNRLSKVLSSIVITHDTTKLPNQTIANAFAQKPNFTINTSPRTPNEVPHVKPEEKLVDARAELLKKMEESKKQAESKKE